MKTTKYEKKEIKFINRSIYLKDEFSLDELRQEIKKIMEDIEAIYPTFTVSSYKLSIDGDYDYGFKFELKTYRLETDEELEKKIIFYKKQELRNQKIKDALARKKLERAKAEAKRIKNDPNYANFLKLKKKYKE